MRFRGPWALKDSKGTAQWTVSRLPKMYESCTPTFFMTIASFHDGYLMSGGFVGSRLP
jgi:hypothetical protein